MSEVGDALQMVVISGRVICVGAELLLKTFLQLAKLWNTVYLSKWKGKTSVDRLRDIKGDDMMFINVSTEDKQILKAIEKEMKAHKILFAKMPDLCGGDGRTQYVINESDIAKLKAFMLSHVNGKNKDISVGPIKPSDYLNTGMSDGKPTPELDALMRSAREEMGSSEPVPLGDVLSDVVKGKVKEADLDARDFGKIYEGKPIFTTKEWMLFPMPDGIHGIAVPIYDTAPGTDKNMKYLIDDLSEYSFVDMKAGTVEIKDGKSIVDTLDHEESIDAKNARMKERLEQLPEKDVMPVPGQEKDQPVVYERKPLMNTDDYTLIPFMDGRTGVRIPNEDISPNGERGVKFTIDFEKVYEIVPQNGSEAPQKYFGKYIKAELDREEVAMKKQLDNLKKALTKIKTPGKTDSIVTDPETGFITL